MKRSCPFHVFIITSRNEQTMNKRLIFESFYLAIHEIKKN